MDESPTASASFACVGPAVSAGSPRNANGLAEITHGKLLPRFAGPIARFLHDHPHATRWDLLDFIQHTWGVSVSRIDIEPVAMELLAWASRLALRPSQPTRAVLA
jgi:hypothetical protein